jgi:hypothetical protein
MKPNGLFTGMNPYEMAFRAQGNDATAAGTTIAFYRQSFDKPVKVARYIAVTPNFPVFAAQATRRIRPRITTAFFMNLLEINGNKPYHQSLFVKGAVTPKKWAESWPKLSALFLLQHKKKTFTEGPNNLIADLNLSIYSENNPPPPFRFMWGLTPRCSVFISA